MEDCSGRQSVSQRADRTHTRDLAAATTRTRTGTARPAGFLAVADCIVCSSICRRSNVDDTARLRLHAGRLPRHRRRAGCENSARNSQIAVSARACTACMGLPTSAEPSGQGLPRLAGPPSFGRATPGRTRARPQLVARGRLSHQLGRLLHVMNMGRASNQRPAADSPVPVRSSFGVSDTGYGEVMTRGPRRRGGATRGWAGVRSQRRECIRSTAFPPCVLRRRLGGTRSAAGGWGDRAGT